jgi:hypothetical protein
MTGQTGEWMIMAMDPVPTNMVMRHEVVAVTMITAMGLEVVAPMITAMAQEVAGMIATTRLTGTRTVY